MRRVFILFQMKNQKGFISIIAIGVFALLMIFAISLQMTTIDTLQNLKNGENHDQAQDIADSMMEYLQWKMKSHEAGWNTGKVVCGFGSYKEKTTEGGGNTSFCQDPGMLALANPFEGQAQKKY